MGTEEFEEHWLRKLRGFTTEVLDEIRSKKQQLHSIKISLSEANPADGEFTSLWVDGGSASIDLVGGSLFIVRAAAGLFRPEEEIIWYQKTNTGFTTLPRNVNRLVGLYRDILEIECVLELLGEKPDYVVLDNGLASYATMGVPHSILQYFTDPQPDDSPQFDYFNTFMKFMKRFDILIQQCKILGSSLIGAAKDPKSRLLSRKWNLGKNFIDSSLISMVVEEKTGFTEPMEASFLKIPRVSRFLESKSVLVEERGKFMTMFGVLRPRGRVFRIDFPEFQKDYVNEIRRFLVSMHDGNGYLLPSHIVHKRATMPLKLSEKLADLILTSIAKEDMSIARSLFSSQRRSRFG